MSVISTSSALLSRLAANQGVKLGNDGQLRTQSGVSRIFQKICDAFNSLSKTGSKAIEERTLRLEAKMAEVLRGEKPVVQNLAAAPLMITKAEAQANHTAINKALLNVAVTQLAKKMVPNPMMRIAAANLVKLSAQNDEKVMSGGREALLDTLKSKMADLVKHAKDLPLTFSYAYDNDTFHKIGLADVIRNKVASNFERELTKANAFDANNVHNLVETDGNRKLVAINGKFIIGHEKESFLQLFPQLDPAISRFISTVCTQAGFGAILSGVLNSSEPDALKDHPQGKRIDIDTCVDAALLLRERNLVTNLEVVGNQAHITISDNHCLEFNGYVNNDAYLTKFIGVGKDGTSIAGRHYEMKVVIDLNQDMSGKQIPDYTLSGKCSIIPPGELPA